jgi:nucleotide-binding universal stress UspA family protein
VNPRISRILVPTDFSALGEEALDHAVSLANIYGAELVLLHVVDDAPILAIHTMELATDAVLEDTTVGARVQLDAVTFLCQARIGKGIRTSIRRGNPHEEIVRCAVEEACDLIVMATHGRTGFAHALLGSVAERVVQHSSVPVLTVKPLRFQKAS